MKRPIPLLMLVIISFALGGCQRDGEVNTTLATIDSFTNELLARIETAPAPSAGIDDAQKYLDERRSEIIARMRTLKSLPGYQVSDEAKKKLASNLVNDALKIGNLKMKYASQSMSDSVFAAKLDKLVQDYQALLTE